MAMTIPRRSTVDADIKLMEPAERDGMRLLQLTTAAPCCSISAATRAITARDSVQSTSGP